MIFHEYDKVLLRIFEPVDALLGFEDCPITATVLNANGEQLLLTLDRAIQIEGCRIVTLNAAPRHADASFSDAAPNDKIIVNLVPTNRVPGISHFIGELSANAP